MMVGFAVGLPPLWDLKSGLSGVGVFSLMDQGLTMEEELSLHHLTHGREFMLVGRNQRHSNILENYPYKVERLIVLPKFQ